MYEAALIGGTAVVVAAWAVFRLRPPEQTVGQAVKLLVSFGPRPTTPK